MTNHHNKWLAGIAALALVAGTGLALGQETSTGQSQGGKSQATQQLNKGSGSNKMGQSNEGASEGKTSQGKMSQGNQGANDREIGQTSQGAAENNAGESKAGKSAEQERGSKANQRAQEKNKANRNRSAQEQQQGTEKNAAERNQTNTGRAAQQQNRKQPSAAEQGQNANQQGRNTEQGANTRQGTTQGERNGMQGLQGNATGMNVQLTSEQRTRIHDTVISARGAPRVGHVDFDVTVGTAIPRGRIHVIPVPETLVRIEPRWRGFLYFVYEQEVVIVDPHDYKIVAVVPA
jgi:hypothetical protein